MSAKPKSKLTDDARQQAVLDVYWLDAQDVATRAAYGARYQYDRDGVDDEIGSDADAPRRSERLKLEAESVGRVTSGQLRGVASIVAQHYGVSKAAISKLLQVADSRPSTAALPRPGRPTIITPSKVEIIVDQYNKTGGRVGVRQLTTGVQDMPGYETKYKGDKRNGPSKASVWRTITNKGKVKISTIRDRPPITPETKRARLAYCQSRIHAASDSCDLDEARVRQGTGKARRAEIVGVTEKTETVVRVDAAHGHPPNLLLMAMVKAPGYETRTNPVTNAEEIKFDPCKNGKVALFWLRGTRPRKKARRDKITGALIDKANDPIMEDITVSGRSYSNIMLMEGGGLAMLDEYLNNENPVRESAKVLVVERDILIGAEGSPAAEAASGASRRGLRHSGRAAGKTRLQEDGAGGHGFAGWGRTNNESVEHARLREACARRNVLLEKQPPNSPETNMCDLGVWNMLKAAVQRRGAEIPDYIGTNTDAVEAALWEIVKEEWDAMEPRKLFNIAMVKEAVFELIVEMEGGELGKDPHVGVRRLFGTGSPKR